MEADREALAGLAAELVLAAEILAVLGEEEPAAVGQAELDLIAVVARRDPLAAVLLGTLAGDAAGMLVEVPLGVELGAGLVRHDQRRVRRRGAQRRVPGELGPAIGTAVHDQ